MTPLRAQLFSRYLLPGLVFQSIIIAGGYGTGRELVEFFLNFGPRAGLLGMLLLAMPVMSLGAAASFEFARVYHTFDYRSFFVKLLGRGWFLYELGYLMAVLLILGVIGAAAGTMLTETVGLPYAIGVIAMMLAVGFLVFKGTTTIEGFMTAWSLLLYGTYVVFFIVSVVKFGGDIVEAFSSPHEPGWAKRGFQYGVLQVSLVPAVLFTIRRLETRREAVTAGVLAGVIAIMPALLFFMVMAGQYPAILDRPVPANYLLEVIGSRAFQFWFQIVLFGTLIETGSGLIHAFNERVAGVLADAQRELPLAARPAIAAALLVTGALLSSFGIVALVGRGYTTVAWYFLAIYVIPVLTVGIWKLRGRTTRRVAPRE